MTAQVQRFLWVAAGAVPGALLRWQTAVLLGSSLPPGGSDLLVNGVGSFLLGWLVSRSSRQELQLLLGAGFCGSLTTFSSWMLVTARLQQQGLVVGLLWLALGLGVGLAMAWLGLMLDRVLAGCWVGGRGARKLLLPVDSRGMNSDRPSISEQVAQQLAGLLQEGSYDSVKHLLAPLQPADIAEAVGTLPTAQQALAFRLLPKDLAIEVYEDLEPQVQQALLETLRSNEVLEVVEQMAPDDRVRLFDELPAKVVRRLLQQLSPEERRVTAQLLGYAPGTAGRLMTTEFIALKQQQTVAQALNVVRRRARETETVYALYVTDGFSRLTGTLSLRELVTAEPDLLVAESMTRGVVSLTTEVDQEEAARLIQRYDFLALPVVDRETRLVGIITVDDVIDVIEQEATEDLYAAGGIQTADEDDYFQINLLQVARRRLVWLLVLLLANMGTASVIAAQDEVLSQYVSLAAFIPLLIGTGGNVGAQSSTVVIRGLSTRRIQAIGAWQSVLRESAAGALLGVLLSGIVSLVAWVLGYPQQVALAVGGSLLAIATMAATAGSLLPLVFRRLGFDPALMSAPFITTVVDVAGVFVYLQLASTLLLNTA